MLDPVALIVAFAIVAVLYVWMALALQRVLGKAGHAGWPAWVPVYNGVVFLHLAGFSGWWILLGFVPLLNVALVVVLILAAYRVNVAFDFRGGMTVLAVLLPPVWLSVLAWGSAEWLGHDDPPAEGAEAFRDDELARRLAGPLVSLPDPFEALVAADPDPQASAASPPPVSPDPSAPIAPAGRPAPAAWPGPAAPSLDEPALPAGLVGTDSTGTDLAPGPRRASRAADETPVPPSVDSSFEVSAVVDAPRVGEPRAAAGAVSALWRVPDGADDDQVGDETVLGARRRRPWSLTTARGRVASLTADVVIVGRRPSPDARHPQAQLVPVPDDTRTMSKTHARLERHGEVWTITDLDSTNGVFLLAADGSETEVLPGSPRPLTARFLLGDAELGILPE